MKLAYRLLLIVGHTMGDLALPLMRRQCERIGASMDTLSPEEAMRLLPALERAIEVFMVRPRDLEAIAHELKVEIGKERFAQWSAQPPGG